MKKSGEWRTKPRLVSTGPPMRTLMRSTRAGTRISAASGTIPSWTRRSEKLTSAAGRLMTIPIAPSAEWAHM